MMKLQLYVKVLYSCCSCNYSCMCKSCSVVVVVVVAAAAAAANDETTVVRVSVVQLLFL